MAAMQHLCNKIILLDAGRVIFSGAPNEAIRHYLSRSDKDSEVFSHIVDLSSAGRRDSKSESMLETMEMYAEGAPFKGHLSVGGQLSIYVGMRLKHAAPNFGVRLLFENVYGQRILDVSSAYHRLNLSAHEQLPGHHTLLCEIPSLSLLPGQYSLTVIAEVDGVSRDKVESAVQFSVERSDYYGGGKLPGFGYTVIEHQWHHKIGPSPAGPAVSMRD
jgi:lipopolysaccharide transport system ATP-binding protein